MGQSILYWDLSEKERAALTREGVERFIDAELMLKGVLAPTPLDETPIAEPKLEKRTVYVIGGEYSQLSIAFPTEDAARKFLELGPMRIERRWDLGDVPSTAPLHNRTISALDVATEETVTSHASEIKAAQAAKKVRDDQRKEFDAATKKITDVLKGLWDDWHECREKATRIAKVVQTFAKYKTLTTDDVTAAKFLAQAFTAEQIAEAEEWTGETFTHGGPHEKYLAPVAAQAESSAGAF